MYPYVPQQGLPDTLPSQQRDTSSSPVSRTSSSIPVSYPVISQASLDKAPKQPRQQAPLFPDIQLNKDTARPALSVPPVAVTQETTRPGRAGLRDGPLLACLAWECASAAMTPDAILTVLIARQRHHCQQGDLQPIYLCPPPLPASPHPQTGFFQRLFGTKPAAAPAPPSQPLSRMPSLAPLGAAAALMSQRVVWAPRQAPNPVKTSVSPLALLLFVAFLAAAGYYFFIRITRTLDMGNHTW